MADNFSRERTHLSIQRYIYVVSIFIGLFSQPIFAHQVSVKVLDNKNKPVSNLVVYLEPPASMTVDLSDNVVEVAQIDKSFSPYIGVMQKGASVKFHNKDNITHHIYSPVGDNKFAFKISAGQERLKSDFSSAGEIAMGCNIHDWMSGHLLILETPYFAKTNEEGVAIINIKDAGEYNVVVWHPQLNTDNNRMNKSVKIDKQTAINMTLSNPLGELPSQKNEEDFDFLSDY